MPTCATMRSKPRLHGSPMGPLVKTWMEGTGIELMLIGSIWLGWSLTTSHIRDFFDLRLRVRRHLERMADSDARTRPSGAAAAPREEPAPPAAEGIRALGYELLSFAHRAPLSARMVRLMGYD